jgi:hypothetical protein
VTPSVALADPGLRGCIHSLCLMQSLPYWGKGGWMGEIGYCSEESRTEEDHPKRGGQWRNDATLGGWGYPGCPTRSHRRRKSDRAK